jgi:hypothetical protein
VGWVCRRRRVRLVREATLALVLRMYANNGGFTRGTESIAMLNEGVSLNPEKYQTPCTATDSRYAESCRWSRFAPSFRCVGAWNLTDLFFARTAETSAHRAFFSGSLQVAFGAGNAQLQSAATRIPHMG